MKFKGINYDTGIRTIRGGITRETFDPAIVEKEIDIIKNELHCNAIRISGLHLDRMEKAAEIAIEKELTVWFSPAFTYETQDDTFQFLLRAAGIAERLRADHDNVIFVAGCELTLFTHGFAKGATLQERMATLFGPASLVKNILGLKRSYNKKLNAFLTRLTAETRKVFHGQVTYASGTWEKIDWDPFDIIGIDHYRAAYNKANYLKELKTYLQLGKPVNIMEFGCCAYQGADDKGPIGWNIVDWTKPKPELKAEYKRDEEVQSRYLIDLLTIFEKEKVVAAFAFTFVFYNYQHDEDPKYDLDLASYGIVRPLAEGRTEGYKGLPWLPKAAFFALGRYYQHH